MKLWIKIVRWLIVFGLNKLWKYTAKKSGDKDEVSKKDVIMVVEEFRAWLTDIKKKASK